MRLLELNLILTMKYLFDMEYNLLQNYYDTQCELFINGKISWIVFTKLEIDYYKRKQLFIMSLN